MTKSFLRMHQRACLCVLGIPWPEYFRVTLTVLLDRTILQWKVENPHPQIKAQSYQQEEGKDSTCFIREHSKKPSGLMFKKVIYISFSYSKSLDGTQENKQTKQSWNRLNWDRL